MVCIDAGAAASQIFETAGLETDKIEPLIFVEASFQAGEVLQGRSCGGGGEERLESG